MGFDKRQIDAVGKMYILTEEQRMVAVHSTDQMEACLFSLRDAILETNQLLVKLKKAHEAVVKKQGQMAGQIAGYEAMLKKYKMAVDSLTVIHGENG